jgi:hypothetical protein
MGNPNFPEALIAEAVYAEVERRKKRAEELKSKETVWTIYP